MKKIIFYSWQSDSPNSTNRGLIEDALKSAAKEIANDESIDVEPVIDRDTQGVAGAPDIATTIFRKIDAADIFVADISLVVKGKKRWTPNPNVLIELGYALKSLEHERVVLVFNEKSGKKEKLPFDLKTRRILTYQSEESDANRSEVKANLTKDLKTALILGLSHERLKKPSTSIIDVIKNNTTSKVIDLREYLEHVFKSLKKVQPKMSRDGGNVDDLLTALPKTEDLVAEFAQLSQTVVLMSDTISAREIFNWFGKIKAQYHPEPNEAGKTSNADGDFFKFVGQELFTVFITPFLREEKWNELHEILKSVLRVPPNKWHQSEVRESWGELSDSCPLLIDESRKRNRMSLYADLLKERHEGSVLSKNAPFREFSETDFFLFLYGPNMTNTGYYGNWHPQSVLWLTHTPAFITGAVDYPTAMRICRTLEIADVAELQKRLSSNKLRYVRYSPITDEEIKNIGSTGGAKIIV